MNGGVALALALVAAVEVGLLVRFVRIVWFFNREGMPRLWELLERRGLDERVRRLRDEAVTNLPQTQYLYDEVDCDDPEIRALKQQLRAQHRAAILSMLTFVAVAVAAAALLGPSG
jgi:hypothetical protein